MRPLKTPDPARSARPGRRGRLRRALPQSPYSTAAEAAAVYSGLSAELILACLAGLALESLRQPKRASSAPTAAEAAACNQPALQPGGAEAGGLQGLASCARRPRTPLSANAKARARQHGEAGHPGGAVRDGTAGGAGGVIREQPFSYCVLIPCRAQPQPGMGTAGGLPAA